MKLKDAEIGKYVFIKKSAPVYDGISRAFIIRDLYKSASGSTKIVLDNGLHLEPSRLTDTPCEMMSCTNCKYHPRRK